MAPRRPVVEPMVYRIDGDAVVVLHVFAKKTRRTRRAVIEACQQRLRRYGEL